VRTEETSGRKHSMETWLAMAIPDPAFFLVGVDDGETPAYHEEFGEATAILARDGFLGTALALVGTEQIVLYLEYKAEGRLVRVQRCTICMGSSRRGWGQTTAT
jgi:hypothetical protein